MTIPAVFHFCALLIALCVQTMATPLAGAWLFFCLCGCIAMYHPAERKDLLWYAAIAWLLTLATSTFLLAPVINGSATMWILSAMPMLALTMRRQHLRSYLGTSLCVLTIYAVGLIIQLLFHVHYTRIEYFIPSRFEYAVAWPLLDPNNAAAVINIGLIPCFYIGLRKPRWLTLCGIFAFALFATASKAGAIVAILACASLAYERYSECFHTSGVNFILLVLAAILVPIYGRDLIQPFQESINTRIAIWTDSAPLLRLHPLTGLGLGTFYHYYAMVRTEHISGGWYAHNDILQLAIEMGIPAATIFCCLCVAVILTTTRRNVVSAVTLLAIFLQAMVEFQFYLPAISMLLGVALAYHRLNKPTYLEG